MRATSHCFVGLDIHDRWDWSVRHPVLRLDFSGASFHEPDALRDDVTAQLNVLEDEAEVVPRDDANRSGPLPPLDEGAA